MFFGFRLRKRSPTTIIWYEKDRKDMKNLLVHKFKKMLIFDQKILEVAISKNLNMW